MRKWIDLFESADTLYHGTCIPHYAYIVAQNVLTKGNDDAWGDNEAGVSFTTDREMAQSFGERSLEPYQFEYPEQLGPMPNSVVVLTASRKKLESRHRVEDFQDEDFDESEVRVFDDVSFTDLTGAEFDQNVLAWWVAYARLTRNRTLAAALKRIRLP